MTASVALARALGAEGRGQLAGIQLLPTLAWGFVSLGFPHALIYFVAKRREHTGEWLGTSLAIGLAVACVAAICLAPIQFRFLAQFDSATRWAGVAYCLFLPFSALVGLPLSVLQAHQRFKAWNALRLMPQVIYVTVVGLALLIGTLSAAGVALVYLAAFSILGTWVTAESYRRQVGAPLQVNKARTAELMRYGVSVVLTTAPGNVYQRLDQVMIAVALSPADLGRYVIGVTWAGLASIPAQIVGSQILARLPGATAGRIQHFFRLAIGGGGLLVLISGFALAVSAFLVPFIFGKEFGSAVGAVRILVASGIFAAFSQLFGDFLRGLGRPAIPAVAQWAATATSAVGLLAVYGRPSLSAIALVALTAAAIGAAVSGAGLWWSLRRTTDEAIISPEAL